MSLSRRTWLWTSTAALAAACTRPGLTKLPGASDAGGGRPEEPRELTRRGAENLIAFAELGAAIRWLHPSDQARQLEWDSLLLDGVRSLEGAGTRAELVAGLRGLFAEVAPTVVVWRSAKQDESDELDEPACPEAAAKDEPEGDTSTIAEDRARPPKHGNGRPPATRPKPPLRTAPGEPSDDESPDVEAKTTEVKDGEAKAEPNEPGKDAENDGDGENEPALPLPEALFAVDESLTITQWYRRGYADGLADDPGCAIRVEHDPNVERDCVVHPTRKRRRRSSVSCSGCDALEARPLAPAAPMRVELPRGLGALVPLGLWTRDGRTLPEAAGDLDAAPEFAEAEAFDYSLEDRGTRLLVVLRTWSLLRRFSLRRLADARALLIPALCAAAEDPSPVSLRATVETLLAGFADGNAALIVETGKAARRYVPELTLAWVEERVVVVRSADEDLVPGDVVSKIDGASIDTVLAEQLVRTSAATASAAIVRTVARLLERDRKGVAIALELLRASDDGERELAVTVSASQRAGRREEPADLRPARAIVELEPGRVYVDATRVGRLARAARRLRKAELAIVDLRGELADPRGSLLASFLSEPMLVAIERMPTGPDPSGELPLEPVAVRRIEPEGPRVRARVIVLADARTRGRAELELAGFDRLGATSIGSASAGDLGGVATAWLPGGWQLRFTHSELRRYDGVGVYGVGVSPTIHAEATRASIRADLDPLIVAALAQQP